MAAEESRTPDGVGELELLRRLQPFLAGDGDDVLVGSGDDAAVIDVGGRAVAVAVDVLVEGVHFRADWSSLADVGWKAVAVNVSDIAAMGGEPRAAVVGLCRPATVPATDVEELYSGLDEACRRWGVRLVGGDTVDAGALAVAVTVLGDVEGKGVRRSGAQPGDEVVVVGVLGAAGAAVALAERGLDVPPGLGERHRRPVALVAAGRALAAAGATAMIDCSDGLGVDLGHVCEASEVAARIDADRLPVAPGVHDAAAALDADVWRMVVAGGEDFALIATVPAGRGAEAARGAGAADGVAAAVVGEVTAAGDDRPRVSLRLPGGEVVDATRWGYEHHRRIDTS